MLNMRSRYLGRNRLDRAYNCGYREPLLDRILAEMVLTELKRVVIAADSRLCMPRS